jgi:hypothetical protein
MADNSSTLKSLDRRIRSSLAYTNWVSRNKGPQCLRCGTTEHLECHHIIDLYHVILGMWKFYGDPEEVFKHINVYHENDMLEGVTLCHACHQLKHQGRVIAESSFRVNTETWCVIPRRLKIIPNPSSREYHKGSLGLVAYQTLFGIGWNLLNDQIDARMLTINRRRFAELLGKEPGTSFNRSLQAALTQLQAIGIVCAHCQTGNDLELHLSSEYLEMMNENPWFVPLRDIQTNSMFVLCLRLWLGMQSKRHNYSIGLDKLKVHMGMTIQRRDAAIKAIRSAMEHVDWSTMEETEPLQFKLNSRPPTPIRSLRAILTDVLIQAQ